MANDYLTLYSRWLQCNKQYDIEHEKQYVQESFGETLKSSPAYQEDALVNGNSQPIVATRKETRKCDFAVVPGDNMHIGDLVYVFNEYWLCVELYVDEYGMKYGELWMCNQVLRYQDHNYKIIEKHAILDDGSYANGNDKAILVPDNNYTCYVSIDDESRALFIDKRLAISVIYDANGSPILEAGKVKWIDVKSRNYGEGSHLMLFGLNDDPYNEATDSLEQMICDYVDISTIADSPAIQSSASLRQLIIEGRAKLRIGSGRTYSINAIDIDGNSVIPPSDIIWSIESDLRGITIQPSGTSCIVSVAEDSDLSGSTFIIKCISKTGDYKEAQFEVEVT